MDVFISYSRDDTATALRLASAIEEGGFSVWWDRKIPLGASFDDIIQRALEQARVVVVLLTVRSVKSQWVQYEIGAAIQKIREDPASRIICITSDDLNWEDVPMPLRRFQTLSLSELDSNQGRSKLLRALAQ
jgi:hypothetical protein